MKTRTTILVFLTVLSTKAFPQFARIEVSRSSVYVQEPFRVTITVLTPAWFTAPPEFSHLQIPNAFILPFDQTIPGMFTIGGKQYAGIQFYYIVFPYKSGRFTVPPFPIQVTGPPEGSAVSRKWNLRTREIPFTVKAAPADASSPYWLVAKNVFISERWNKSLTNLKVGDVLERANSIEAKGTLPQFIPAIPMDSLNWASEYPREPQLKDERTDYDANGSRVQKTIYLLEKEGDFTVPQMRVYWWNPQREKMFSKITAPIHIHVAPNENLGILKTLQDSLSIKPGSSAAATPRIKKIYGLPWYLFYMYLLEGFLCMIVLIVLMQHFVEITRKKLSRYRSSEKYWFERFRKSKNDPGALLNNFYKWLDHSRAISQSHSSEKKSGDFPEQLYSQLENLEHNVYSGESESVVFQDFKNQVALYRKEIQKQAVHGQISAVQNLWTIKN